MTGGILAKLLIACAGDRLVDLRDRARLLMDFASGGRRRSEVAGLRVEDLVEQAPVRANPTDEFSPLLRCLTIRLGRTKTTSADDDEHVVLIGRPVISVKQWFELAKIDAGPVFRRFDQWGNPDRRAMTPQSAKLILKTRIKQAGLAPAQFFAHGLRSGYLTEAAIRDISLPEAMQQSMHKSVAQASGYNNIVANVKWDALRGWLFDRRRNPMTLMLAEFKSLTETADDRQSPRYPTLIKGRPAVMAVV